MRFYQMSLRGAFAATWQSPLNRRSLSDEQPIRLIEDCFATARNDMQVSVLRDLGLD